MKIDLSCPIEVRGYVLSYTENGMQAAARLYNLTTRRIASFEAVARWRSGRDGRKIVCPFSMERVHACGESIFQISLDNTRLPDADSLEILFNTVRFEDSDAEWHAGDGPFAEMNPLPPMSAEELSILKDVAGEDAVCYPSQNSQAWTCVCGRINSNSTESCARCHRSHFTSIGYTPEKVRFLHEARKPVDVPAELPKGSPVRRMNLFRRTLLWTLAILALTAFIVLQDRPAGTSASLNASASVETAADYH